MSMILDKKQKIKKLGNLKKNFKNNPQPTGKASNLIVNSFYTKSPRQKSFILKNKKRNLKSNDVNLTKNININEDDTNFLLSENDPFSRSVIYSNNKKISNNFFPSIKHKKIINDISIKKNQRVKFVNNNKNKDYTKRKIGSAQSIKNSNIKTNNMYNNLNISEDFPGISKFSENFQLIEDKIIDKNYENDIDHDEMIINSNRKNVNTSNNNKTKNINKGNNSNKLSNIIGFNNTIDMNDDLYLNINKNNNFEINENYLLNTSFENQRSDFSIMYTYDYEKTVLDDLLSLEIKLVVEKMLEMQKSYHKELNLILNQYNKNKEIFNLLIEKITFYRKKIHILQKMEEKKNTIGNIYNFVNIYHNNNKHEVNKINKSEFNLWKNIIFGKNKNNKIYDKEKIRQIFKIIAFDRYYKISNRLNNIEEKIVLGLMKKYKYNKNNDVKSYNNSNYKTTNNKHYKSKSNKNNSTSPIQAYKMVSKRPRNDNSEKMNKMKYKKLVSISQPKQANIYNFKNIKQK